MTNSDATERCESLAYELSKNVSKIYEIRNSMEYIAKEMEWDDMLIMDFDRALVELSNVVSGATVWALEGKYFKEDVETMRREVEHYDKSKSEDSWED